MKILFDLLYMGKNSLVFTILIFLICCTSKNKEAELISYDYVKQVINSDIQSDKFFVIIIPVNVCSNCIEAAFKLSSDFNENDELKTIVIADYSKQLIPYKSIMKDKNFYFDLDLVYKKYDIELIEPVLLKFNDASELEFYKGINNENINILKNEIQSQLSTF